jgi:hypothetical protein
LFFRPDALGRRPRRSFRPPRALVPPNQTLLRILCPVERGKPFVAQNRAPLRVFVAWCEKSAGITPQRGWGGSHTKPQRTRRGRGPFATKCAEYTKGAFFFFRTDAVDSRPRESYRPPRALVPPNKTFCEFCAPWNGVNLLWLKIGPLLRDFASSREENPGLPRSAETADATRRPRAPGEVTGPPSDARDQASLPCC